MTIHTNTQTITQMSPINRDIPNNELKKRIIKKRLIRKSKQETTQEPKPKTRVIKKKIKRNLIRTPKSDSVVNQPTKSELNVYEQTTDDEQSNEQKEQPLKKSEEPEINTDYNSDDDFDVVLVINWKCSHYEKDYLLDPTTQEVFCKKTRDLLGVRYKNEDNVSLIEMSLLFNNLAPLISTQ